MAGQAAGRPVGLTAEENDIQQLKNGLKSCLSKEFSVTPYDGMLMAVPKEAFSNVTGVDSINYELISYGENRQVGTGLLKFLRPGPLLPLFPTDINDDCELSSGLKFMKRAIILHGAHHLDKTADVVPGMHEYDQALANMAENIRNKWKNKKPGFVTHSSIGASVLDHTSPECVDGKFGLTIMEMFFPEICEEKQQDYVLYIACHPKASVDYILSNLNILNTSNDKTNTKVPTRSNHLYVSPNTLLVNMENPCVNSVSAFCRMLICHDNPVMFNKDCISKIYGSEMSISDNVLKTFNETLEKNLTFDRVNTSVLPASKFLVSMMASLLKFKYPIPVKLMKDTNDKDILQLFKRIVLINDLFIKQKAVGNTMQSKDQLACIMAAILDEQGISPKSVIYEGCQDDQTVEFETVEKSPWPNPLQQHIRNNIQQCTDGEESNESQNSLRQTMIMAQSHLLCILSGNHVFNADIFLNPKELHHEFEKASPGKKVEAPNRDGINNVRVKAVCNKNLTKDGPGLETMENIFLRLGDPMTVKRFVILNALFILRNREVGKQITTDSNTCSCCSKTSLQNGNDEGKASSCISSLLHTAFAEMCGTCEIEDIRNLLKNQPKHEYAGLKTSYKTLHTLYVNETRSGLGHFGKILLKHEGRKLQRSGYKTTDLKSPENGKDQSTGPTDTAEGNEQNHASNEKDGYKQYRDMKKLGSLVEEVKRDMARKGTLTIQGIEVDEKKIKNHYLWNVQYLGSKAGNPEDLKDFAPHVTGIKDNITDVIKKVILDKNMLPEPFVRVEHSRQKPAGRNIFSENVRLKTLHLGSENVEMEEEDDDNDDDEDSDEIEAKRSHILNFNRVSNKKSPNRSYLEMAELAKAIFMNQLETSDNVIMENISAKYQTLIEKCKKNPQGSKTKFIDVLKTFLLGETNCTIYGYGVDTSNSGSLFASIAEAYLERLIEVIREVHDSVAKCLNMTSSDLEKEVHQIVHNDARTKREIISWIDTSSSDSLQNRSNMLSIFNIARHVVETHAEKADGDLVVRNTNAMSYLKDPRSPHCTHVSGNAYVHYPVVIKKDGNDELTLSTHPAQDADVTFDFLLPMKTKIALNPIEIDFKNKKQCVSEQSFFDQAYGEGDPDSMHFIPQPLLIASNSKSLVMANTPRPVNELYQILCDRSLDFTKIGQPRFMDVTEREALIDILHKYITQRTGFSKLQLTHPLVFAGFLNLIKNALNKVTNTMDGCMKVFANLINAKLSNKDSKMKTEIMLNVASHRIVSQAIEVVVRKNFSLGTGIYMLALCSELYSPLLPPRDSQADFERDNHAVGCLVAGCLRLFVSNDDCNSINKKIDAKCSRLLPVVTSYMRDEGRPFVTSCDVNRSKASLMTMLVQIGSYVSMRSGSAVFTTPRGGAPISRGIDPVVYKYLRQQMVEGEGDYNQIICLPLVKVCDKTAKDVKENVASMVEDLRFTDFLQKFSQDPDALVPKLASYYSSLPSIKGKTDFSREDMFRACLDAHGIDSDDPDCDLFQTIIFDKIYMHVSGKQETEDEDSYECEKNYEWTDDEDIC